MVVFKEGSVLLVGSLHVQLAIFSSPLSALNCLTSYFSYGGGTD